jgi:hypothetical protein
MIKRFICSIMSYLTKPNGLVYHPTRGDIVFDNRGGYTIYCKTDWGIWELYGIARCSNESCANTLRQQCHIRPKI